MQRLHFASILLCLAFGPMASASEYKTVPVEPSGTVTAYVDVPSDLQCHVTIPELPTAFCAGRDNLIYHMRTISSQQGTVDPDQYYAQLLNLISQTPSVSILAQYPVPAITQYRLQRDAPLLFLRGEQAFTYGLDSVDRDKNETGVSAIVIAMFPNNNAPMTVVDAYSISLPSDQVDDIDALREELVRFVNSYRYDPQWVQVANAQTVNFENNLSARENAFYTNQQRIHQNNMNALDQSYNAYRERSAASDRSYNAWRERDAASDRMQSQTVDAIQERQQLIDPTTGERYEADGYANYNYVNPYDNNMSVRTDNPNWDPNVNNNQGEIYRQLEEYNPSNW